MIPLTAAAGLLTSKAAWAVAAASLILLWGGCGYRQADKARAALATERLTNLEEISRVEREYAQIREQLSSGNAQAQAALLKARQDLDARARAVDQRLRDNKAWAPTPEAAASASACRDLGAPAVAVIPGETREDLVAFAKDADAVSTRLAACQSRLVEYQKAFQAGKP